MRLITALLLTLTAATLSSALAQTKPSAPRPTEVVAGWKPAADPFEAKARPRLDTRTSIPAQHNVHAIPSNRPGTAVVVYDDEAFAPKSFGTINLQSGTYTPAFKQKLNLENALASPDGLMIAGRVNDSEPGAGPVVEVLSVKTGKVLQRIPSADKFRTPDVLGFGANSLITFTDTDFKPRVQAWDLSNGTQIWETPVPKVEDFNTATMSPNGKYLAVVAEDKLTVLDLAKGDVLDTVPLPQMQEKAPFGSKAKGVAWSPDGLEVAAFCEVNGKSRLVIWDMATGQVLADKLGDEVKDDRWSRKEIKLEFFPGDALLRFSDSIIDRASGKSVGKIPPLKPGKHDEFLKAIAPDRVLAMGEKEFGDNVPVATVQIKQADIEKAEAIVRTGGKSEDVGLPPVKPADWSGVRTALDAAGPPSWTLKPDSPSTTVAGVQGTATIPLRQQQHNASDEYSAKRVIFTGPPANQAAILYQVKSNNGTRSVIERVSVPGLAAGAAASSYEFPGEITLLDISADGKLAMVRHTDDRVDLYALGAGTAKPAVAWRPYEGEPGKSGSKVDRGIILSAEAVITLSNDGRLVLWNTSGCKAVYEMKIAWMSQIAVSPNRKQLAFGNGRGCTVIDSLSGEVLASMQIPSDASGDQPAFSPDGTRLAWFTSRPFPRVMAWDLHTGKQIGDCALPKEAWTGPVTWHGANYVLVGDFLVDLTHNIAVWRYQRNPFGPKIDGQPDERFWTSLNEPRALVGAVIPHPSAQKALAALTADQNIVLKPGMKVSIEVNVAGNEETRKKVRESLAARAQAAGLVLADNQPIKITATTTQKGSHEIHYMVFSTGPTHGPVQARQTASAPEYECKLAITKDGQTLWEVATPEGGAFPDSVRLKEGQSIQSLVNEMNANPGAGFFTTVPVPGTLAKPIGKLTTSRATLKGIVDQTGP